MTVQDLLALPVIPASHRYFYGPTAVQFGDLYLPEGEAQRPFPVLIMIHGGCWLAEYGLDHASSLCAALSRLGIAVWSLEYRRLGDDGGGWPGTFIDVGAGVDFVRTLAESHPLDPERVAVMGHSAGGQLAMWAAGRSRLSASSPLWVAEPLPLTGVIGLAPIVDLTTAVSDQICDDLAARLMGGTAVDFPERYADGSPLALLPLGVRQTVIMGQQDEIVPAESGRVYAQMAQAKGEEISVSMLPHCGHYELVTPGSGAWERVKTAVLTQLT